MIIARNLVKKFKSPDKNEEIVALDHLSLTLPDKGLIAIVGASGCGKSTLLHVLGGLEKADSGSFVVDGRDSKSFSGTEWDSYRNQMVGFIFQNYYLLPHLTVFENVAITLELSRNTKGMKEKVMAALERVGLTRYAKRLPRQLSGGQQQRVAVARALVSNPSIILADEPTGALDAKSSIAVMDNLKDISTDHLVVMVTHNERLANEYADRIIEISYGKILKDLTLKTKDQRNENIEPLRRIHTPFLTSIKWGTRNVIKKKGRSIPIAVATGIGLAACGVVISMTQSVNKYVQESQDAALSFSPIYVHCVANNTVDYYQKSLTIYPDSTDVIIERSGVQNQFFPIFDSEFNDYVDKLVPGVDYGYLRKYGAYKFNLYTEKNPGEIMRISDSNAYTAPLSLDHDTLDFVSNDYTVLAGHMPENENEVALLVDKYNCISERKLKHLGFSFTSETDVIKWDDIVNKEYRCVDNDDVYYESTRTVADDPEPRTVFYRKSDVDAYNSSSINLKITAILRVNKELDDTLFDGTLLFHPDFYNNHVRLNEESAIVKAQKEHPNYSILDGHTFIDDVSGTKRYYYEATLVEIGGLNVAYTYLIYTNYYEQRAQIINYFNAYKNTNPDYIIKVKDSLGNLSNSFASITKTYSTVVLVFAIIAIIIAGFLTAILTYISVVERTREIGLLRSLGSRCIDIFNLFLAEACIVGVIGGVLSVALSYALSPVASGAVINLIEVADTNFPLPTIKEFAYVPGWIAPFLIGLSLIVAVISSLAPAIVASRKRPAQALKE